MILCFTCESNNYKTAIREGINQRGGDDENNSYDVSKDGYSFMVVFSTSKEKKKHYHDLA